MNVIFLIAILSFCSTVYSSGNYYCQCNSPDFFGGSSSACTFISSTCGYSCPTPCYCSISLPTTSTPKQVTIGTTSCQLSSITQVGYVYTLPTLTGNKIDTTNTFGVSSNGVKITTSYSPTVSGNTQYPVATSIINSYNIAYINRYCTATQDPYYDQSASIYFLMEATSGTFTLSQALDTVCPVTVVSENNQIFQTYIQSYSGGKCDGNVVEYGYSSNDNCMVLVIGTSLVGATVTCDTNQRIRIGPYLITLLLTAQVFIVCVCVC